MKIFRDVILYSFFPAIVKAVEGGGGGSGGNGGGCRSVSADCSFDALTFCCCDAKPAVFCVDGNQHTLHDCGTYPDECFGDNRLWAYGYDVGFGGGCGDILDNSPGRVYFCDTLGACKEQFSRRRQLQGQNSVVFSGDSFEGDEEEFLSLVGKCASHKYQVHLHVTNHLYAVLSPTENAIIAGCPYMVAHAIVGDREDSMSLVARKELLLWNNREELEELHPPANAFLIGTFVLQDLLEAYHSAEVKNVDHLHYDAFSNNCSNFLINVAKQLGIEIDSTITSFVTRRLVDNAGTDLIKKIRNSAYPYLNSLFPSRHLREIEKISDEKLIELVVEARAREVNYQVE